MSKLTQETEADRFERPPSVLWRMVAIPVIAYAAVALLGLISYDSADISSISAPALGAVHNWMGAFGAWNAYSTLLGMGAAAPLLPLSCLTIGVLLLVGKRIGIRVVWMIAFALAVCALLQFANEALLTLLTHERLNIPPNAGGGIGFLLNDRTLMPWIGKGGTITVYAALLVVSAVMFVGPMSIMEYLYKLRARDAAARKKIEEDVEFDEDPAEISRRLREEKRTRTLQEKMAAKEARLQERQMRKDAREAEKVNRIAKQEAIKTATRTERVEVEPPATTTKRRAPPATKRSTAAAFVSNEISFKLPTARLLHPVPPNSEGRNQAEVDENTSIIEGTLAEFGINVEVTGVICGPVITCYELKPPPGVRVDKISTYSNDLQMALKANSVRILSPIPGKNVMGIEIPNHKRRTVSLREVAERPEWKNAVQKHALPMLLGMDVSGTPVIADLAKMPHILIAGATGSGKSVCLNSILAGFMLARTPDDLRLLMVDPKMVEFTPYAGLSHLIVPIITAPKKVAATLQWAIVEMKRRLELFKNVGVKNIMGYNNRDRKKDEEYLAGNEAEILENARQADLLDDIDSQPSIPEKLPYIVIVIDEMADLMMSAQSEVQPRIVTLAQLSRAVGIHMILATQRPSVNVITGLIKANFPARIAFKVSQRVDSQTILDAKGAEHLIGAGDMLFSNPNGTLTRAQGTWIDEEEVTELVTWFKNQGEPVYVDEIKSRLDRIVVKAAAEEFAEEDEEGAKQDVEEDADAELLVKALECIVNTRRASTSSIQRALRIGYNRAARVMDELERQGCVGPANGAAPRDILRTTLEGAEPVYVEEEE